MELAPEGQALSLTVEISLSTVRWRIPQKDMIANMVIGWGQLPREQAEERLVLLV